MSTSRASPALHPAPITAAAEATTPLFGRADLWFGAATAAVVTAAGFADRHSWREALTWNSGAARSLANAATPFGTPMVVAPGLALTWGVGRFFDRPGLESASVRIAGAVLAAGAATELIKLGVGRKRPAESPGDPDEFRPFSHFDSFPSGHTSVAFATAAAIDEETSAAWVPWVLYPAAALVGWSRVRDDKHWVSDVVAGAALGTWVSHKADRLERDWSKRPGAPRFFLRPSRRGVRLGARLRF